MRRAFVAPRKSVVPIASNEKLLSNIPPPSSVAGQLYKILITRKCTKKRKIQDDGVLVIKKGICTVYDTEGKVICRGSTKDTVTIDEEIKVGAKMIYIVEEVLFEAFVSGKIFVSPNTTDCPPRNTSIKKGKPFKSVSCNKIAISEPRKRKEVDLDDPERLVLHLGSEFTVSTCVDLHLSRKLREHQKEGVKFLFRCVTGAGEDWKQHSSIFRGCILADDMGLGKTIQCIALLWTLLKQGPVSFHRPWVSKAIIVVPSSLTLNWKAEINKWLGSERLIPVVISGGGSAAKDLVEDFAKSKVSRVLIISYEMLRKHIEILKEVKQVELLICDEGHRLKSSAGNQTIESLKKIPTLRRILLTGTPVQNELSEFYAMVDFVNPGCLGSCIKTFQRVFQEPIEKGTDGTSSAADREVGVARATELRKVTEAFILRRTSEINEKYLPERQDISIFLRMGENQEAKYQSECEDYFKDATCSDGTDALGLIHRLRQICTHPCLASADITVDTELFGKVKFIDCLLARLVKSNTGDKVVLVSNSTKTLDLFELLCRDKLYGYLRLDGSTQASKRQDLVDRFNLPIQNASQQQPIVFLLSAKAGGCGLNLIGANRLFLLDPDWNPAVDQQAAARIWRDGQTKPVFIYRLLTTGTIEERIYQRQIMKMASAQGILSEEKLKQGKFSRDDLKELFRYNPLTNCDTYTLMRKSPDSTKCWPSYESSDVLDDQEVKQVVDNLGQTVVSWINCQSGEMVEAEEEEKSSAMMDSKYLVSSDDDECEF